MIDALFVIISTRFPQISCFLDDLWIEKFCPWKESHIIEAVNNRMTVVLILWIRLCFPLTKNFLKEGKLGTFRKDLYFILQQLCEGEKSFGNLRLPFLVDGLQNTQPCWALAADGGSPPTKDFLTPVLALFGYCHTDTNRRSSCARVSCILGTR